MKRDTQRKYVICGANIWKNVSSRILVFEWNEIRSRAPLRNFKLHDSWLNATGVRDLEYHHLSHVMQRTGKSNSHEAMKVFMDEEQL